MLNARVDDLLNDGVAELIAARPHHSNTPPAAAGPLPWLPGIPARLADNHDWGPFAASYHQLVLAQIHAVREAARDWTGATAPAWAQPFLEDDDTDLRAELAVWRAVAGTDENDLRPTGDRTIGAPGAHQVNLNRAVREARPSYPFSRRSWTRRCQRPSAKTRGSPRCPAARPPRGRRAARVRLHHEALKTDPCVTPGERVTNPNAETAARPLPDEHQAAALWWRLVPHLGPAALGADVHSANLLQPTWRTALAELVGTTRGQLSAEGTRLARTRRGRG